MSASELSEQLRYARATNPLLEIKEASEPEWECRADEMPEEMPVVMLERIEDNLNAIDSESGAVAVEVDEIDIVQLQFDQLSDPDKSLWDDPQNYAPVDQRRASLNSVANVNDLSAQHIIPEQPSTLRQALGAQAVFLFDEVDDRRIAHHIIQNINDAGYLDVPMEDIEQTLNLDSAVGMHDIKRVLGGLQSLEPVGVAARDAKECLRLQLAAKDKSLAGYHAAHDIIERHLALLANKDYAMLRKALGVSEQELGFAVALIQQLNPHPGYSIGHLAVGYIVPDIIVEKKGGHWCASLNPNAMPTLSINRDYQTLINQNPGGEFSSMKEQLQQARRLISNLEKRHQTILSVAEEIIERQQDFFHSGAGKIRPLTLNDIAEPLGIHESTVSIATAGKYLSTPQGNFELEYFFGPQITGVNGDAISATAIQAEIQRIVQNESPAKPVSDEKICALLAKKNYQVGKRALAKYRQQMNIPPSAKRKSF